MSFLFRSMLGVTAGALRTKIDRKSAISLQRGHFDPKFQVKVVLPFIFARIVRPMNALQFCRCQYSHKETFFKQSAIYTEIGRFAFLSPPSGTQRQRTMIILGSSESAYSGLPISDNGTFSLGVTAEALQAKMDRKSAISLQRGHFDPNFQVERTSPANNFCMDS